MNDLLDRQDYNAGSRPSERQISEEGFLKDNGGSIPPNLISLANTNSNSNYQKYCREHDLKAHPARFPSGLPAFFIRMLTDKNDLVFDPFAGSCITGEVAEHMDRRWICCEIEEAYVKGAKGRFLNGEQDLFPQKFESNRKEPYRAYPPFLSILSEENAPLPEDGGQTRSSRKNADEEQKEPEGDGQSEDLFAEDGS
jgi:site-specific DNA-methyltransferase (cytosine-N4-specific)